MNPTIQRYQTILSEHQIDRTTAATLVLAEGIDKLVKLLANVDDAVARIDGPAHATTPTSLTEQAAEFIKARYLTNPK